MHVLLHNIYFFLMRFIAMTPTGALAAALSSEAGIATASGLTAGSTLVEACSAVIRLTLADCALGMNSPNAFRIGTLIEFNNGFK
jgi:hypothetical protein